MNVFIWMFTGAALGWATFMWLGWSDGRGKMASIMIGGMAGILGGKLLQPIFVKAPLVPTDDFSLSGLVFAIVLSLAILAAANMIFHKWKV
jgi:uncharacterized membrane protein YeaQ/YmgE (transglycosylase-associated protein family)